MGNASWGDPAHPLPDEGRGGGRGGGSISGSPGNSKGVDSGGKPAYTCVKEDFFEPKANIGVDTCGNERIRKKGDCGPS